MKKLPKYETLARNSLSWEASRPLDSLFLPLKMENPNYAMFFQFYSKHVGKTHWGKSEIYSLEIGNGQELPPLIKLDRVEPILET